MEQEDYEIETAASREAVWQVLEDAKNWNRWNTYIEYAHLNGSLANGTNGSFKAATQKPGRGKSFFLYFKIKNCIPYRSFTISIKLFLCTLDIAYTLVEDHDHTTIQCRIKVYGPLSWHYQKRYGAFIKSSTDASLAKLKSAVEALKIPR